MHPRVLERRTRVLGEKVGASNDDLGKMTEALETYVTTYVPKDSRIGAQLIDLTIEMKEIHKNANNSPSELLVSRQKILLLAQKVLQILQIYVQKMHDIANAQIKS